MQLPWYVTAVGAAILWGIHYPLVDNALKRISPVGVLLLTAIPILLVSLVFHRQLAADYLVIKGMDWGTRLIVIALSVTGLLGTVLLYMSIVSRNATLASLIEISYPVFVVLFSYLLFRQVHINPSVVLGGVLVFAGVTLIILNNP
jgi:drug/metabolite transporter (DMT)-like permease